MRFGGTVRGQVRLEVLNVTNTPKVRGPITTLGNATFGQIRVQHAVRLHTPDTG